MMHLLLLSILLVFLGLLPLLTDTNKLRIRPRSPQRLVRMLITLLTTRLHLRSTRHILDRQQARLQRRDRVSLTCLLDILGITVAVLGLAVAAGEDDHALGVFL